MAAKGINQKKKVLAGVRAEIEKYWGLITMSWVSVDSGRSKFNKPHVCTFVCA